jgi:nucleoside-diphosphate-sugar epimerase
MSYKSTILITGGAGYIGIPLVEKLLIYNYRVVVLDNLHFNQSSLKNLFRFDQFSFIHGDVRNQGLISEILCNENIDLIIPLAALVGAPLCDEYPDEAVEINLNSIKTLISLINPTIKIIYPTTNSGYGTKTKQFYCDENSPLEPISLYGRTKMEAEKIILERKNSVTLRLATVFGIGPRMRFDLLVNFMTYQLYKFGKLELFQPEFKRNFIHIDDVVDCFIFCIENFEALKNDCYNVGLSEANLSKHELAQLIVNTLGRGELTFNSVDVDPDQRNYFVSSKKIQDKGFKAHRPIELGVTQLKNYLDYLECLKI